MTVDDVASLAFQDDGQAVGLAPLPSGSAPRKVPSSTGKGTKQAPLNVKKPLVKVKEEPTDDANIGKNQRNVKFFRINQFTSYFRASASLSWNRQIPTT